MKYLPLIATLFCLTSASSATAQEPDSNLAELGEVLRSQIKCIKDAYALKAKNVSSKKELAKTAINFCLAERKLLIRFYVNRLDTPLEKAKDIVLASEQLVIERLDAADNEKTSLQLQIIALVTVVKESCKDANITGIEKIKERLHNELSVDFAYYRSPEVREKAINSFIPEIKREISAKGDVAWCQDMKKTLKNDPESYRNVFID